ncbi:MAG: tetratricopeptide repeat protein [bacterium]|nr:tetratricopeptide repeat protein [bacterium]
MLLALLTTKYSHLIAEGWGAYEIGNFDRAEEHFREVLENEDDPQIGVLDVVEAHNGMGAVNLMHKDFFEATRWYREAKYLLDQYYEGGRWPKRLDWFKKEDRPAMRALIGLAHLHYRSGAMEKAKELYTQILRADKHDGLGAKQFLEAIEENKPFEQVG